MYKVKLTPYRPSLGAILGRQTSGGALTSSDGRYRFYINEPCDEPDFWVVQGKGVRKPQTCRVAPANTVLLTTEPASVLIYPRKYTRQFGTVCTCQPGEKHPNPLFMPPVLPWFVGYERTEDGSIRVTQDYDSLVNAPLPEKKKLISVITSDKAFTQGHIDRIRFVERLKQHYGDTIDVFGHGIRNFNDKWDVLAPYRYHIVIENSCEPYYWTEKLGDCYLCGTYPIYCGCTNVGDYFPDGAYTPISLSNFDAAVATIDRVIAADTYAAAEATLQECRQLMLHKYNMFDTIARVLDGLDPNAPKHEHTIRPCHSTDDWHNAWRYAVSRNYYKLKLKATGGVRL